MDIKINGQSFTVHTGTTVAAAIMNSGLTAGKSLSGKARNPLCGMGVCYECRAEVNGIEHERTCMILCSAGMEVKTS